MKGLILIIVILMALGFIEPTYASPLTAFKNPPDCTMSNAVDSATELVLECRLIPTDNAYVDDLLPTKSFGGSGVLIVENVPSVPVARNYAFLKFDLAASLPSSLVQSGARPENASLQMYVRLMNFFYNATVEIHNASPANWTENTLTWNTMPQVGPGNVSINIVQNGTWARWDITRLIQPLTNSSEQLAFAAISSQTSWRNLIWFDSDEYPFANGTTSPTLDLRFVEPYLTVQTPFPDIPISVGPTTFQTNANGSVKLLIPWGNYAVTVPDTVPISNGTRAQFVNWSDRMNSSSRILPVGNNVTLNADYGIQHELIASSLYGTVGGAGWYFQNADATLTLSTTAVPVEGVEGLLGARNVFDHWTGACSGSSPQCSVSMSRPQYAEAVWRVDWSQTIIGASALVLGGVLLAFLRKKRTGHRPTGPRGRTSRRPRVGQRRRNTASLQRKGARRRLHLETRAN
jgi:hypothetical protein